MQTGDVGITIGRSCEALCQDCLRLVVLDEWADADDQLCECGGEVCPCDSCKRCLQVLRAGERRPVYLGLQRSTEPIVWNERTGTSPTRSQGGGES